MAQGRNLPTIDQYIHSLKGHLASYGRACQANNQSRQSDMTAELNRVQLFVSMLDINLTLNEQLNPIQLMWRLLSYARLPLQDNLQPFFGSESLRNIVIGHLCSLLGVTVEQVKNRAEVILANQIAEARRRECFLDTYYVSDRAERMDAAKQQLIHERLVQLAVEEKRQPLDERLRTRIVNAIDQYLRYAETKYFKAKGKDRARALRKEICEQWYGLERLSSEQVLHRLLEQVRLPAQDEVGLFGSSKDLRLFVVKMLCESLGLNEGAIQHEIQQAVLQHTKSMRLSFLGPIYSRCDATTIAIDIRLDRIEQSFNMSPGHVTELSEFTNQRATL